MSVTFVGTEPALLAIEAPLRGTAIGGPDRWPKMYTANAAGWTNRVAAPYASGGAYRLDVPTEAESYLGMVPTGRTRVLILGYGESGVVGVNQDTGWEPAGFPRLDGTVWTFNASRRWVPLTEPTHAPGPTPDVYGTPDPFWLNTSFGGRFCDLLQQSLGSAYEVGFLPCGWGGATSDYLAPDGPVYSAMIDRTKAALGYARTVLGAILVEQGINDAAQGLAAVTGWAARWTAIESAMRADLGGTACPIYFSRHCATRPTLSELTDGSWAQLLAEQDAWASAGRRPVQKPEGPWNEAEQKIHLTAAAQMVLAARFMDAWIAHPGVTS